MLWLFVLIGPSIRRPLVSSSRWVVLEVGILYRKKISPMQDNLEKKRPSVNALQNKMVMQDRVVGAGGSRSSEIQS